MADENGNLNDTKQGEGEAKQTENPRTFTQEELNQLIEDRLKRDRAAREREEAEKKRLADIEKLEGEEKLKAQHKNELDKIAAERDEFKRLNAVLKAGEELAKMGYDTELAKTLIGADDDTTKANLEAFDKAVKAEVEKRINANLNRGAPPAPNGGTGDSLRDALRRGAGM